MAELRDFNKCNRVRARARDPLSEILGIFSIVRVYGIYLDDSLADEKRHS